MATQKATLNTSCIFILGFLGFLLREFTSMNRSRLITALSLFLLVGAVVFLGDRGKERRTESQHLTAQAAKPFSELGAYCHEQYVQGKCENLNSWGGFAPGCSYPGDGGFCDNEKKKNPDYQCCSERGGCSTDPSNPFYNSQCNDGYCWVNRCGDCLRKFGEECDPPGYIHFDGRICNNGCKWLPSNHCGNNVL
ncbi:hypothetical protein COU76_05450, partial [Candidatus Peregrinibacteria bacterium CG10_big_fil_rev_8_21_14_0_10_49_10]